MKDKQRGEKLLEEVYEKLIPSVVQRLDSSVLDNDLDYMQQAVIHVRQTKMQLKLYRAFKKTGKSNFLERYSNLFPVCNHPGCLIQSTVKENDNATSSGAVKIKTEGQAKHITAPVNISSEKSNMKGEVIILEDSEDEDEILHQNDRFENQKIAQRNSTEENDIENQWWSKVYKKHSNMADITNGHKMILLIQILAHADFIGEKVVVFSQCLKTLNFIERILQKPDWSKLVPEVKNINPKKKWGCWTRNVDYLRIDGSIQAKKRGELINQFNDEKLKDTKLFLISSKAGNVGINLIAANRVVLFDSHWNPAMDEQAIYRCYRYGQRKAVYVYRFLTQGKKSKMKFVALSFFAIETLMEFSLERHNGRKSLFSKC